MRRPRPSSISKRFAVLLNTTIPTPAVVSSKQRFNQPFNPHQAIAVSASWSTLTSVRWCSTNTPPSPRADGCPPSLQQAFGETQWKTFTKTMPTWEKDLNGMSKDSIRDELKDIGIPAPRGGMATALVEHFQGMSMDTYNVPGLHHAVKNARLSDVSSSGSPMLQQLIIADGVGWFTHVSESCSAICFVRHVYVELWKAVLRCWDENPSRSLAVFNLLIVGNPGIGKSWALNYLLHMALQDAACKNRIVMLRSVKGWFTFHNGKCYKTSDFIGSQWLQDHGATEDNRALLLHDMLPKHGFEERDYGNVTIVLASSPNRKRLKPFRHFTSRAAKFVVPTWSKDEFIAWASVVCQDASLVPADEFHRFGGVLRGAFDPDRAEQLRDDIIDLAPTIPVVSTQELSTGAPTRLFQLVPHADYTGVQTVKFLSEHIEREFMEKRRVLKWEERLSDLRSALALPLRRGTCGCEFEDCILKILHKGTPPIDFKKLEQLQPSAGTLTVLGHSVTITAQPKPTGLPTNDVFSILPRTFFDGSTVDKFVTAAGAPSAPGTWRVCIPNEPNYPLFDFMLVNGSDVYGVQVTVGAEHPSKGRAAASWLEECGAASTYHLKGIIYLVDEHSELKDWQGFETFENGWTETKKPSSGGKKSRKLTAKGEAGVKEYAMIPQWLVKVSV